MQKDGIMWVVSRGVAPSTEHLEDRLSGVLLLVVVVVVVVVVLAVLLLPPPNRPDTLVEPCAIEECSPTQR